MKFQKVTELFVPLLIENHTYPSLDAAVIMLNLFSLVPFYVKSLLPVFPQPLRI